jgi:WhiB family redox-sensing transcriptional regulator
MTSLKSTESRTDGEWMKQGNCRGMDIEMWFPEVGRMPDPFVLEVCRTCDVQRECLEYAVVNVIDDGIWGGATPNQRKQMRRGRR